MKNKNITVKSNAVRNGCKDTFKTFLIEDATFDGSLEIPTIKKESVEPNVLIPFSKCIRSSNNNCWVHFYEDDVMFERIWNNPKKYLNILKKYNGVISPDFSIYRDFPLVMQQWNTYRNRAIGSWLQQNGIKVIPNVRFGDKRTYSFCCLGIEKGSLISIGTHGTIKNKFDRELFEEGLMFVVNKIKPSGVVVYGSAPKEIFDKLPFEIKIYQFDSDFYSSRKEAK